MSVSDCSQKAVANLGMTDVKFTLPVFCGDTIYGSSEVLDKRESKSRMGQGIVEIKTTGTNQDNKVVCTFLRQILIPAKGHAVEDKIENY
jgi:acyl dehydratase